MEERVFVLVVEASGEVTPAPTATADVAESEIESEEAET